MKNWNLTQLNFTNEEYKKLVSSYWKLFIIASQIDGDVDEKEIDTILSLIVRTPLKPNDWEFFKKMNHIWVETENKVNGYRIKNNYLQVFELENLVFFEIERNMINFITALTNPDLVNRLFEEKLDDAKKQLDNIKNLLESKVDIVWQDYIVSVYEWLYDYIEKIVKLTWKWFFIRKIGKEEKQFLELVKNELNIDGNMTWQDATLNRHNYILFD